MSPETLTPRPEIPVDPVGGFVLHAWTMGGWGVVETTYRYDIAADVWSRTDVGSPPRLFSGWRTLEETVLPYASHFYSEQDAIDAFIAWGHKRVEALRLEANAILAMMLNRGRRPAGGSR